jgi:hypothetical protein
MAKEKKHSDKKKKAHKFSSHGKKKVKSSDGEDKKKKKNKEEKKKKKHHKEAKDKKKSKTDLGKRGSEGSGVQEVAGNITEEISREDFFRLSEEFRVWLKLSQSRFCMAVLI